LLALRDQSFGGNKVEHGNRALVPLAQRQAKKSLAGLDPAYSQPRQQVLRSLKQEVPALMAEHQAHR